MVLMLKGSGDGVGDGVGTVGSITPETGAGSTILLAGDDPPLAPKQAVKNRGESKSRYFIRVLSLVGLV
jgi:hypothetical protein